jgi:hypothetical protein
MSVCRARSHDDWFDEELTIGNVIFSIFLIFEIYHWSFKFSIFSKNRQTSMIFMVSMISNYIFSIVHSISISGRFL